VSLLALILATIVDLLLAVLLVAVSGFVFEGPEGARGELSAVLMWSFALLACLGLPAAGFVLRHKGYPGVGAALAWLPPLGALFMAFVPGPY
jgi:hypothetical protein